MAASAQAARSGGSRAFSRDVVRIRLRDAWHETITRREGLKRLARQELPADIHEKVAERIPPRTEHYLTFAPGAFREFVDLGDGLPLIPVLLLAMSRKGRKFTVAGPVVGFRADGEFQRFYGIKQVSYENRGGILHEDGIRKTMFKEVKGRPEFDLDVSMLNPSPRARPGDRCCGICHWVHSVLGLHVFDCVCCMAGCVDDARECYFSG
jgi:hypothetical protein